MSRIGLLSKLELGALQVAPSAVRDGREDAVAAGGALRRRLVYFLLHRDALLWRGKLWREGLDRPAVFEVRLALEPAHLAALRVLLGLQAAVAPRDKRVGEVGRLESPHVRRLAVSEGELNAVTVSDCAGVAALELHFVQLLRLQSQQVLLPLVLQVVVLALEVDPAVDSHGELSDAAVMLDESLLSLVASSWLEIDAERPRALLVQLGQLHDLLLAVQLVVRGRLMGLPLQGTQMVGHGIQLILRRVRAILGMLSLRDAGQAGH